MAKYENIVRSEDFFKFDDGANYLIRQTLSRFVLITSYLYISIRTNSLFVSLLGKGFGITISTIWKLFMSFLIYNQMGHFHKNANFLSNCIKFWVLQNLILSLAK